MLQLRNPHSVLAALKARPKDVIEVILPERVLERSERADSESGNAWMQVKNLASKVGVPVRSKAANATHAARPAHMTPTSRDNRGPKEGRESGAEAHVRDRTGISVEELFSGAKERADGKGLWIALDTLQDPQNLGAIFRTAAFFGVQGIFLTQDRSAPLSSTAYDVSSGGLETVPFTLQPNLQRGFEAAKEAGLWILGTSEHANDDLAAIKRDRPWLLVLGNEEKGMRRLTEESCDVLCKISSHGEGVTSLNVSVAAGIFISTLSRNS